MVTMTVVTIVAGAIAGMLARAAHRGRPGARGAAWAVSGAWLVAMIATASSRPLWQQLMLAMIMLAAQLAMRVLAAAPALLESSAALEDLAARWDAARYRRGFDERSWMIRPGDRFSFDPERDFREFDRWIRERKRTHGRDYFTRLRDDLKARGEWAPDWSDRSA